MRTPYQIERDERNRLADETSALMAIGRLVVPGVRIQDQETTGRLWLQVESGELSHTEWELYVADLHQANKVG